jgi:hypothetical protein
MADAKISALTGATTPVAGTEVLPIVQSSSTKKLSITDLTAGRSVSASSYVVTGSTIPTNGMYLSAANVVSWATNSSYRMALGSGGLSINTTTSNAQLTVASSNTGTGTPVSGNSTLWLMNDAGAVTANNGPAITFNARSRTSPTEIQVMAGIKGAKLDANNDEIAGYLAFYTSDNSARTLVERAKIDNLGNFSIGGTLPTASGTGSPKILMLNDMLVVSGRAAVPSPYTQNLQIDIVWANWGGNPVLALVDLVVAMRQYASTSGAAFGKIFATNSANNATLDTFTTTDVTTSRCAVTAASGGNYTLRLTINPTGDMDAIGYTLTIPTSSGGTGSAVSSITVSLV